MTRGRGRPTPDASGPRRFGRLRDERGVSAVEFALLAPLLVLLLAGITDLGLLLQSSRTTTDALHSAARQGARAGNDTHADLAILRALQARFDTNDEIQAVVVYRADGAGDGLLPATCKPAIPLGTPTGVAGLCNIYPGSLLGTPLNTADFDDPTCISGEIDDFWCPDSRSAAYLAGDRLGVWVSVRYTAPIGLVVSGTTIERNAVFRLEVDI